MFDRPAKHVMKCTMRSQTLECDKKSLLALMCFTILRKALTEQKPSFFAFEIFPWWWTFQRWSHINTWLKTKAVILYEDTCATTWEIHGQISYVEKYFNGFRYVYNKLFLYMYLIFFAKCNFLFLRISYIKL